MVEEIITSLNQLNSLKQRFNNKLKREKIDLTIPQALVLNILKKHGPLKLNTISELLEQTSSNITCIADSLEKKFLVERVYNKTDRRVINLHLTISGERLINRINSF